METEHNSLGNHLIVENKVGRVFQNGTGTVRTGVSTDELPGSSESGGLSFLLWGEPGPGRFGDEVLQAELMQYSTQRGRFRGDLESMMRAIEVDPSRVGQFPGVVRQRGVHPLRPLPGGRQEDIIAACEQSENAVADGYSEALRSQLPSEIENVIASQYRAIKTVRDRIRSVNGVVADA